jgi:hypothetical protein
MPLPSFLSWLLFGSRPAEPAAPEPLPATLEPEPAEPEPPPPPFDSRAAWRSWLAEEEALASLYRSLQVQPALEESCRQILAQAKAQLRVEIPDPETFVQALERLVQEKSAEDPADAAWIQRGSEPLLHDLLARRHFPSAMVARLEERPADELLPFLEEIPARRGGEIVWRLPRELALLRRRPARLEPFLALMGELASLIRKATLERSANLREALLETLERCGRDAADPAIYLPSSLRSLEEKLGEWLAAPSAELRERRRQLDALLFGLLETGNLLSRPRPIEGAAPAVLRARSLAADALKAGWPLLPCVIAPLLYLLLLAELADRPPAALPVAPALEAMAAEMASGFFDPVETARRLRALELHDCWVSSLIFALLRLATAPGGSVSPAAS